MGRLAAGAVHLLTAAGAVLGLAALEAIAAGRFEAALWWMAAAVLVDGLDGPLARRFEVTRRLPWIDGALMDNVVDYLNWVVVPAWFLHRAALLPSGLGLAGAGLVCVASAFQFARTDAKTADNAFTGFPSYWNVVVLYLLQLEFPPWLAFALVLALAALVFVPVRYVHPVRTREYRGLTLTLTALWALCIVILVVEYPERRPALAGWSLLYGLYYGALSLWLTWRKR